MTQYKDSNQTVIGNERHVSENKSLVEIVSESLPTLDALALGLEIYGRAEDVAQLRGVIKQLRSSCGDSSQCMKPSVDFIVNGTFKVSRQQVANTLWHAFTGEIAWFRIAEAVPPRDLRFRSIDQTDPGLVDYPLNEGGAVFIRTTDTKSEVLELRLERIATGLEELACHYPRHFADLVNENADSITADVLLQCCLFGELIYS